MVTNSFVFWDAEKPRVVLADPQAAQKMLRSIPRLEFSQRTARNLAAERSILYPSIFKATTELHCTEQNRKWTEQRLT